MNTAKRLELGLRRRFPAIFVSTLEMGSRIEVALIRKRDVSAAHIFYTANGQYAFDLRDASKYVLNNFYGGT